MNKSEEKQKEGKDKVKKEEEIEELEEVQKNKEEEEIIEKEFYKYSYKLDSDDLFKRIKRLVEKPDKSDIEKKIIFFLKKQLNEVE